MSRTTQSHKRQPFAAGLLVALAGLASPLATSQAQGPSPERALLNSIPVSFGIAVGSESPTAIDGDRALLGRSAAVLGAPSLASRFHADALVVNGEQALLGQVSPSARGRLTMVW
jgi:hypothetical protein